VLFRSDIVVWQSAPQFSTLDPTLATEKSLCGGVRPDTSLFTRRASRQPSVSSLRVLRSLHEPLGQRATASGVVEFQDPEVVVYAIDGAPGRVRVVPADSDGDCSLIVD